MKRKMLNQRMSINKAFLLLLVACFFLQISQSQQSLCHISCQALSCTNALSTGCVDCAPYFFGGSPATCDFDTSLTNVKLSQLTPGFTFSSGADRTCSTYSYQGNYGNNTQLNLTTSSIPEPHYQVELIVWAIKIDQWPLGSKAQFEMIGSSQIYTITQAQSILNLSLCGRAGATEGFYRLSYVFTHNNTITNAIFKITTVFYHIDSRLGIKDVYLVTHLCNSSCLTCYGGASTQCYSCIATHWLSGSTCHTACLAGYGTNPPSKVCIMCHDYCLTCGNATTSCTTCKDTAIVGTNVTASQIYKVQDQNQCVATCPTGYSPHLATKTCLSCSLLYGSGCNSCDSSNCLTCLTTYGLNTNVAPQVCFLCSTISLQCLTCDSSYCLSCSAGYVRSLSTPSKACVLNNTITSCLTAVDGPQCASCLPGLVAKDPLLCQTCIQAYGSTCLECHNSACLTCQVGFSVDNSSSICTSCTAIHPSCLTCSNGPVCTSCDTNFYLNLADPNWICVPCTFISNCLKCKDGPQCLQCSTNFILDRTGPGNKCLQCLPSSYSTSTNLCSPCPQYCSGCYQSGANIICTSCQADSALDSFTQKCQKCNTVLSKCTQCSSLSSCTQCDFPYVVGNTNACDKCLTGYQFVNNLCTNILGCHSFTPDLSQCLACSEQLNFYYEPLRKKCICLQGFSLSNSSGFSQCVSECGDGILVSANQVCDDGNVRNDDGYNDQCNKESGFNCTKQSPSQCTLDYTPSNFQFNYAQRYEGENKCKFVLSLTPPHSSFKYIDWSKYLSFNISDDFFVKSSKRYFYSQLTNELSIQIQYLKTLEAMTIEFLLSSNNQKIKAKKTSISILNSQPQDFSPLVGKISSNNMADLQIPKEITLVINLKGANSKLIYEDQAILKAYKGASITSLIITILIFVQFVIGSYFHKMIGLETIQVLQFFYFVRIIIQQNQSTFLSSMNVFKYIAYGGYSDYLSIYGSQAESVRSLTFLTVTQNFVQVGLMKYFSINVNFSLIVPVIFLVGFLFWLGKKYLKRNTYMKTHDQAVKDQYTVLRRSCQWGYDHFVFPYINIFSMIVFFSTILYLQSLSISRTLQIKNPLLIQFIEMTSFSPHLTISFLVFLIFCSEVFASYEEYKHSNLTESQKSRVPKSIIQKLEHDENNPDRPNYKPGYVLFYMIFYFIVQVVMMINVLLEFLKDYGVEIMLGMSNVYLIFVWKWNPYISAVNFHNKVLRLNHFVMFLFMAISAFYKRVAISAVLYVVLIYLILLMLIIVAICGYLRILVEYRFRKILLDDPSIMEQYQSRKTNNLKDFQDKFALKQGLLKRNKFLFQNQIRDIVKIETGDSGQIKELTQDQIEEAKLKIRQQIQYNIKMNLLSNRKRCFPEQNQLFEYLSRQFRQQKLNPANKERLKPMIEGDKQQKEKEENTKRQVQIQQKSNFEDFKVLKKTVKQRLRDNQLTQKY